jgi:hypothetical protein
VIGDLSLTLREMLREELPKQPAEPLVAFDRPGENFTPEQPTIDLFLYDIRENLDLRSAEPTIVRSNGHAVRHPPPLRVACTYLVTAWVRGETEMTLLQEHHLLAQTLQVLARYPTIPEKFLQGGLKGQQPPLPLLTAQSDRLREPAEFWSAIGGRLRPSLSVTATIGLEVFAAETLPLVVTEEIRVVHRWEDDTWATAAVEGRFRIAGRVLAADGRVVANAEVVLVEAELSTRTDANGRYVIGPVASGAYTLRATSGSLIQTVRLTIPLPRPGAEGSPPGDYDLRLPTAPSS